MKKLTGNLIVDYFYLITNKVDYKNEILVSGVMVDKKRNSAIEVFVKIRSRMIFAFFFVVSCALIRLIRFDKFSLIFNLALLLFYISTIILLHYNDVVKLKKILIYIENEDQASTM